MIDTGKAKLPGLPAVSTGNASLDRWIQAVSERLEVREGTRGNKFEQVVTWRDLQKLGISDLSFTGGNGGMGMGNGGGDGVLVQQPNGSYNVLSIDEFGDKIRKTKLYADLQRRLDDPTRFDDLPEAVRAILKVSIADEASKRGADIQRLDYKIQSEVESLAYTVQEVTASVAGAHAGIRELSFASATPDAAMAGRVTSIEARINSVAIDAADIVSTIYATTGALPAVGAKGKYYQVGSTAPYDLYRWTGSAWVLAGSGTHAALEETMIVSADRIRGASAEYMVKVNAGAAVAGFGLAATEDPTGATSSTFLVQADQFALTTPYTFATGTTPSATVIYQTWYNTTTKQSFIATATGTGSWALFTPPIPFGVDTTTGTTYINGSLRVGSGAGVTLGSITSGNSAGIAYAYKRSATDLIAGWNATTNGPGAATWTFSSGSITTPSTDALSNGWTKAIPTGTNPLYVSVATAAGTGTTDAIAATDWATPVILARDGGTGANGLNVATAILYQRNASPTVGPTAQANTVTLTFSDGSMTGMSAGWTAAIPSSASGAYLWVTRATASAIGTTDTMAAGEWSAPVLYTQDGANGTTGNSTYTLTVFYQGGTTPTAPTTGTGSYNFSSGAKVVPTGGGVTWLTTQPATSTVATYSTSTTISGQGASPIAGGTWSTPVLEAVNGIPGTNGTSQVRVELYSNTTSTVPGASAVTYTISTDTFGGTFTGWSPTMPTTTTSATYMTTALVSTTTPASAVTIASWTTAVIVAQKGADGASITGTRGTIITKIGTAWNATTAWNAVNAIAVAAGSTPTYPIKGDIVSYTGGANECTVAGSSTVGSGTWGAVAAYIDGSLIVAGTIGATTLSATAVDGKTITGATVQTSASTGVNRYVITGSTITGYDSSNNSRTIIDCAVGTAYFENKSAGAALSGVNSSVSGSTSYGGVFSSSVSSGIKAWSTSGYGIEVAGNTTKAPIGLGSTLTANPSSPTVGDIYVNNHGSTAVNRGLYVYVNGGWHNHTRGLQTATASNVISFDWATPNITIYIDGGLVATYNISTHVWS